jgi:hypothetical protein
MMMKRNCVRLLAAVLLLGTASARADIIRIHDEIESVPRVQAFDNARNDITATNVQILETDADFVHLVYTSTDLIYEPAGDSFSRDLLEADGTISDRLLVATLGGNRFDVQLDSRDTILIPQGKFLISPVTEDGTFQGLRLHNSSGADIFLAASDIDGVPPSFDPGCNDGDCPPDPGCNDGGCNGLPPSLVPEPRGLTLLGIGVVGLLGYGWRRWTT